MAKIHPTAIVEDGAVLGADVEIGPFCTVGRDVQLGDGVRLFSHVVVSGDTHVGVRTDVYPQAVLGGAAQFRGEEGREGKLRIGANNIIREAVTMNRGTKKGGGMTTVGDGGYFMTYSHIGHDCHVGNNVTMANCVPLGGHVTVGDNVTMGGLAAIRQFVRIGRSAFIGGLSAATSDIIPFGYMHGTRGSLKGLNLVGLKRQGMPRARINMLRHAFRDIFFGERPLSERVDAAEARWSESPEVAEIIAFIRAKSKHPICVPAHGASDGESGE